MAKSADPVSNYLRPDEILLRVLCGYRMQCSICHFIAAVSVEDGPQPTFTHVAYAALRNKRHFAVLAEMTDLKVPAIVITRLNVTDSRFPWRQERMSFGTGPLSSRDAELEAGVPNWTEKALRTIVYLLAAQNLSFVPETIFEIIRIKEILL